MLGPFCLTSRMSTSRRSGLRTSAVRDGGAWVLHGVKQFITSGKNADVAIVLAVTTDRRERGISAFLVDTRPRAMSWPGSRRSSASMRQTPRRFSSKIAASRRRSDSDEGAGYKIALSGLEGAASASRAVAWHGACGVRGRAEICPRTACFGQPIFDHQSGAVPPRRHGHAARAARQLITIAAALKDAARRA